MAWSHHYQSPIKDNWQGRHDAPPETYIFQQTKLIDLNSLQPAANQTFAFLGFCSDEGVKRNLGRPGAAQGPDLIKQAIARLPVHSEIHCIDVGNICCTEDLETAQIALGEAVTLLLKNNYTPIVLGGGHEVAFGHFQGIHSYFNDKSKAIINFDAHFDMRPLLTLGKGSSGTPFLQIAELLKANNQIFHYLCIGIQENSNTAALFETAKEYNAEYVLAEQLYLLDNSCDAYINEMLSKDIIYITICLDVFASSFAPGVSAAQPLGLTPWQVIPLLRKIAQSGKAKSYDLAEFAPCFDRDGQTAKLAAQLIFEILHHHKN